MMNLFANCILYVDQQTNACSLICAKASFQRSNSHDKVRRIVAEEGRTARNLIAWSVPLESKDDDGMYFKKFHFCCELEDIFSL